MKKILISLVILIATTMYAQKTSGKVVVNKNGEIVGRYIGENKTQYHIQAQDDSWEPKKGLKVVLYSATNGKGIVFPKNTGIINVRKSPNTSASILAKINYKKGDLPETFDCLGLENGWFKIKIKDQLGYVKADNMEWDSMDTF